MPSADQSTNDQRDFRLIFEYDTVKPLVTKALSRLVRELESRRLVITTGKTTKPSIVPVPGTNRILIMATYAAGVTSVQVLKVMEPWAKNQPQSAVRFIQLVDA